MQRAVYAIEPQISKLYSSEKQAPNLIFLKSSGEKITKDVFLITVHFWNSGTLPIEPQDIRESVEFTITNSEEIIDYDTIDQTNPNTTRFSLSQGDDKKSLVLNWSHLDPNDGAKFHVFYIGPSEPEILFTGNILGRTSFYKKTIRQGVFRGSVGWTIIILFLMIVTGIFFASQVPRLLKDRFKKYPLLRRFVYIYYYVGGIIMVIIATVMIFILLVFTASPPTY